MADTNASQVHAFFRNHIIPNEGKSIKEGRPIFDDMEVCEVRLAGNRQTIGVFPAHDYAEWVEDELGRRQITYAEKYAAQYKKFKANEEQSASGTPISELTFLSEGRRAELKALNIHTVEALAGLDGAALARIGMGGRELTVKAKAYLDNAASTNALATAMDENEKLRQRIAELEGGGKKRASKKAEAEPAEDNPFLEYEAEDIRAWIEDADASQLPGDDASKEELAAVAKSINDKLAKKKAS